MPTKPPLPSPINGLSTLASWLSAAGIEAVTITDFELLVSTPDNGAIAVGVGRRSLFSDVQIEEECFDSAADALKAFTVVATAAGYPQATPNSRKPCTSKSVQGENELTWLRHQEFRRAPNPDPKVLMAIEPVVRYTARRLFFKFRNVLQELGMDANDVLTYAMVWATNYLGLYWERHNFHEKYIVAHINQRFSYLVTRVGQLGPGQKPDVQSATTALYGQPYDGFGPITHFQEFVELDEDEPEEKPVKPKRSLDLELKALGHDRMVRVLAEASSNTHIDPAARRSADMRLQRHRRTCPLCVETQKQATGPQQLSVGQ